MPGLGTPAQPGYVGISPDDRRVVLPTVLACHARLLETLGPIQRLLSGVIILRGKWAYKSLKTAFPPEKNILKSTLHYKV
jgi:hypothetical protein